MRRARMSSLVSVRSQGRSRRHRTESPLCASLSGRRRSIILFDRREGATRKPHEEASRPGSSASGRPCLRVSTVMDTAVMSQNELESVRVANRSRTRLSSAASLARFHALKALIRDCVSGSHGDSLLNLDGRTGSRASGATLGLPSRYGCLKKPLLRTHL